MLYLLNNIEIQNKLQTIYTYVTVVLDELFAEAPAAISLLIVPYLQFKRFLTFEHGVFFVQTLHTFREKATFEDFTIKPTSEGIKKAKLSSLFCFDCRAACSGDYIWTRNEVSRVFVQ